MALAHGWTSTIPQPGSAMSPASAEEYWVDNFTYIECALAVSCASGGSSGGYHNFPGTLGTTAGKHLLGRVALIYVGASAEIVALTDIKYAFAFQTDAMVFQYNAGSTGSPPASWKDVEDFITQDIDPVTISANIAFESAGGSVDGRKYATDGTKLDTIGEKARHVIHAYGTVVHGGTIPWPQDTGYRIDAPEGERLANGNFDTWADAKTPGSWNVQSTSGASAASTENGSGIYCEITIGATTSVGIYQTYSASCSEYYELYFSYMCPGSADIAQYGIYDVTNSKWIVSLTSLASTASGEWSTQQTVGFTISSSCTSAGIYLAVSGAGQTIGFDSVSLKRRVYETITPASCESMDWFIGVRSLSTGTYFCNNSYCYLADDGGGYNRQIVCYGKTWYTVCDVGTDTGTINYILVGVRNI